MTDQPHPSNEALFRFVVVSELIARIRGGEPKADAIRAVAADPHTFFDGSRRQMSERSLYRWLSAYDALGIRGLEPKPRQSDPTALSEEFLDFLIEESLGDRSASIPELIRRGRERGIVKPEETVQRSTVYRTCKRLGLPVGRRKKAKHRDSRRFAYPHRMDMVLCDGKHFRAGEARLKRVALFFLDDATRYVLHVVVGTSETQQLFQRGVYECLTKHGFMDACYVDHGPGFIAEDTIALFANLAIALLHGEIAYKEGRGKIERFNRTVKADVLRALDGRPDVDPDCRALELRLLHYTEQVYAHRPHEGLGHDTPWQRFHQDGKGLRFPDDHQSLRAKFEIWIQRRVANDHVVSVDSVPYEIPKGYAGRVVWLRRRLLDGGVSFLHQGEVIDLHPVDLAANARAPRARAAGADPEPEAMPRKSAADMTFERDFGPVVGHDGGLNLPHDDDTEYPDDIPW